VRWMGIVGTLAAFGTITAHAMDANRVCPDLLEANRGADESLAQRTQAQPLLTDNQCESLKTRELRVPLLDIPQEGEDPMELSVGVKNSGGTIRFKIPFSF
jgi:hypothetical protein